MLAKLDLFTAACAVFDRCGIVVHNEYCLHTRHQRSRCLQCSSICPTGAISFHDGLVFAAEKCVGCGACASVCPSGALSAARPSNEELRSQVACHVAHLGAVAFACETYLTAHPRDRSRVVALPCVARLDESILVEAALSGASTIALLTTACAGCPRGGLGGLAETMVDTARRLLERWNNPAVLVLTEELPDQPSLPAPLVPDALSSLSRRAFFSILRERKTNPDRPVQPETTPVALGRRCDNPNARPNFADQPKAVPERLRLVVDALRRPKPTPQPALFESRLWGDVTVTAACRGCAACAETCPTSALTAREQDGLWALSFETARCTQCGLCRDVCFAQAVTLAPSVSLEAVLEQTPRILKTKDAKEVDELMAPMEVRLSRLLGVSVT